MGSKQLNQDLIVPIPLKVFVEARVNAGHGHYLMDRMRRNAGLYPVVSLGDTGETEKAIGGLQEKSVFEMTRAPWAPYFPG